MNERGGDDWKGKEKKRDLFPLPILHLAGTLFFFSAGASAEERRAPN